MHGAACRPCPGGFMTDGSAVSRVVGAPPEAVDLDALAPWMAEHVADADGTPLRAELIAGGRSNLTFFVRQGDRCWVLRRPPLGHVLPSAHDMRREYTVLHALRDSDVPTPFVHGLCMDTAVIGAPFYVMDEAPGVVLRDVDDTAPLTAGQRRHLSLRLVDVLAGIHAVDLEAVGLTEFGRPDGYLARQVTRWTQQWEASKTRELPEMDRLAEHLRASIPARSAASLVHGDYRLDNVMFTPAPELVPTAVLDWEMSTLGDPLADLGLFLVYSPDPGAPVPPPSVAPQLQDQPGFLTHAEMAQRYAERTGADLDDLGFYVTLGYFKLAIVIEGIHRRFTMGLTVGEGFDRFADEVPALVSRAWRVVDDT